MRPDDLQQAPHMYNGLEPTVLNQRPYNNPILK